MSGLRRRALIAAAVIAVGAPVAAAPGAEAHHCASAYLYVNGTPFGAGSCHQGQTLDHICANGSLPPFGNTYVDVDVCMLSPVAP